MQMKLTTNADEKTKDKILDKKAFPTYEEFLNGLGTWKDFLSEFTKTPKFQSIYENVKKEYANNTCYPPPEQIFNAFKTTPLSDLKVVIVGQDPYHGAGQAMGLCFSVNRKIDVPPSLKNMYKMLKADPAFPDYKIPDHGDLSSWANQGVFLLNDILTVEEKKPASHKNVGWKAFTDFVIKKIAKEKKDLVFMLWGKPAQTKTSLFNVKDHCVLMSSHPSPLSVHAGFSDCWHFSKANQFLKSKKLKEINWQN